jgi:hypothetical protein
MTTGIQPSTIVYDRNLGRFRDAETGQFVPKSRIELEISREIARVGTRLQGITRAMAEGRITIEEWERRFIEILKESHLQMAAFGAGGRDQLDAQHYGYVGLQLKKEYDALEGFIAALMAGTLTLAAALRRANMYAESIRISFNRSDWLTHDRDGFEGARSLSVALHCRQCPDYDTGGRFLPADQLVPIGVDCDCQRNCKCFITWRKRGLSALTGGLLAA